ncbi:MAG: glycosyltransferase family 9 protein [Vicinamibacteria bacterium]
MNLFFAPSRKLAAHRLAHGGPRVYDPRERLLLSGLDVVLRGLSRVAGLRPGADLPDIGSVQRVLALRLDRLGDLITTLPALEALRASIPNAHIELAVGSWNEPVARRLPFVDGVRIVDAPWSDWGRKARFSEAREALGRDPFDLAIDFQGDVRVLLLMALAGAKHRAGYGDTGGTYLLTHVAPWNEKRSWHWQNLELVRTLFPNRVPEGPPRPYNFVTEEDRRQATLLLREKGLEPHEAHEANKRPLVGIHPSAGRSVKEWEVEKFAALADRLGADATVVLTGSDSDRRLVEGVQARSSSRPATLLGIPLATFAAVIERFDAFVSGDTGPMHLSHAVATPNVAIFGPSDPVRYGGEDSSGPRRVVRSSVYCSPCNMIRRPPRECARPGSAPECLARVSVEEVFQSVVSILGL